MKRRLKPFLLSIYMCIFCRCYFLNFIWPFRADGPNEDRLCVLTNTWSSSRNVRWLGQCEMTWSQSDGWWWSGLNDPTLALKSLPDVRGHLRAEPIVLHEILTCYNSFKSMKCQLSIDVYVFAVRLILKADEAIESDQVQGGYFFCRTLYSVYYTTLQACKPAHEYV